MQPFYYQHPLTTMQRNGSSDASAQQAAGNGNGNKGIIGLPTNGQTNGHSNNGNINNSQGTPSAQSQNGMSTTNSVASSGDNQQEKKSSQGMPVGNVISTRVISQQQYQQEQLQMQQQQQRAAAGQQQPQQLQQSQQQASGTASNSGASQSSSSTSGQQTTQYVTQGAPQYTYTSANGQTVTTSYQPGILQAQPLGTFNTSFQRPGLQSANLVAPQISIPNLTNTMQNSQNLFQNFNSSLANLGRGNFQNNAQMQMQQQQQFQQQQLQQQQQMQMQQQQKQQQMQQQQQQAQQQAQQQQQQNQVSNQQQQQQQAGQQQNSNANAQGQQQPLTEAELKKQKDAELQAQMNAIANNAGQEQQQWSSGSTYKPAPIGSQKGQPQANTNNFFGQNSNNQMGFNMKGQGLQMGGMQQNQQQNMMQQKGVNFIGSQANNNNNVGASGQMNQNGHTHQASNSQSLELRRMNFNRQFPPVAPQQKLDQQNKFDAALACMKREGPVPVIPGGQHAAIGVLDGKLVVRGPKSVLDKLKENETMKDMEGDITYVPEGPTPSDMIIAIDFDKTLAKQFLWAELGGLQGANVQQQQLNVWHRDGRLRGYGFGGDERIQKLREVIEARLANGDFVCILSSGFASVIRMALTYIGLSDILPTDLIYGCDTGPYGISKSARLKKLKQKHRRDVSVLVDDDMAYCKQAHKDGHHVIWVKEALGMEDREINKLRKSVWDTSEFLDSNGRIDNCSA